MTRLLAVRPSLPRGLLVPALLCALLLSPIRDGGSIVPQVHAAKRWNKKGIKRGKPLRGRGPLRRPAIAALPPLRSAAGEGTSVMVATAAPPAPAPTAPVVSAKAATPPPPSMAKGPVAATTLKKRKGPLSDEEQMEDAQAAYVRGDRGKAIELALVVAEKSNERSPAAWKFIGLAACSVRSYRLATRAYQGVRTPYDQRAIADACKYNGLSYKGDQFVGD